MEVKGSKLADTVEQEVVVIAQRGHEPRHAGSLLEAVREVILSRPPEGTIPGRQG